MGLIQIPYLLKRGGSSTQLKFSTTAEKKSAQKHYSEIQGEVQRDQNVKFTPSNSIKYVAGNKLMKEEEAKATALN